MTEYAAPGQTIPTTYSQDKFKVSGNLDLSNRVAYIEIFRDLYHGQEQFLRTAQYYDIKSTAYDRMVQQYLNYTKESVERLVDFLPTIDISAEGPQKAEILELWDKIRLYEQLEHWYRELIITGDNFIKPRLVNGNIVLDLVPAEFVTIITAAEDVGNVKAYRIQFDLDIEAESGRQTIQVLEYIDQKMITLTKTNKKTAQKTTSASAIPDNYGLPIIHVRNGRIRNFPYGVADVYFWMDLQFAINMEATNMASILKYYAKPITAFTGVRKSDTVEVVHGTALFLPIEATVANLEMKSDLEASNKYIDRLVDKLHSDLGLPRLDPSKVASFGRLTGRTLQVLYGDMVRRCKRKMAYYQRGLTELNRLLFAMLKMGDYDPKNKILLPSDYLPQDDYEDVEILEREMRLNLVSVESAMIRRNVLHPEEEKRKIQAEQAEGIYPQLKVGQPMAETQRGVKRADKDQPVATRTEE